MAQDCHYEWFWFCYENSKITDIYGLTLWRVAVVAQVVEHRTKIERPAIKASSGKLGFFFSFSHSRIFLNHYSVLKQVPRKGAPLIDGNVANIFFKQFSFNLIDSDAHLDFRYAHEISKF